jgi:hypothetical protein
MISEPTLFSLRPVTLTYGPSIPVTLLGGTLLTVTVTDAVAFVFANPTGSLSPGALVVLLIRNTSGGAHGAGTFGTNYRVAAAVPAIATANSRAILFEWTGALMVELVRGATDVPV